MLSSSQFQCLPFWVRHTTRVAEIFISSRFQTTYSVHRSATFLSHASLGRSKFLSRSASVILAWTKICLIFGIPCAIVVSRVSQSMRAGGRDDLSEARLGLIPSSHLKIVHGLAYAKCVKQYLSPWSQQQPVSMMGECSQATQGFCGFNTLLMQIAFAAVVSSSDDRLQGTKRLNNSACDVSVCCRNKEIVFE